VLNSILGKKNVKKMIDFRELMDFMILFSDNNSLILIEIIVYSKARYETVFTTFCRSFTGILLR
jgi:hypothetical protein